MGFAWQQKPQLVSVDLLLRVLLSNGCLCVSIVPGLSKYITICVFQIDPALSKYIEICVFQIVPALSKYIKIRLFQIHKNLLYYRYYMCRYLSKYSLSSLQRHVAFFTLKSVTHLQLVSVCVSPRYFIIAWTPTLMSMYTLVYHDLCESWDRLNRMDLPLVSG
jgi:hypothetical protein